ncbi:MAG: glycosyltransferase family 4 protein, partial [Chitinophagaceae bacterium]|nr:glycosyltransferase family 4 protein [Chitinophagaceae bacterium]
DTEPDPFFWETIRDFRPATVWCAGWMFPRYVRWSRALKKSGARTICAMDTQWKGTARQRLLTAIAPFTLRTAFHYAWVPGLRQEQYALRLGFPASAILHHLYAPDTRLFGQAYMDRERPALPGKFVYAGRLEPHKIERLLSAFTALEETQRKGWRLQLIGSGSMEQDARFRHPAIEVQPARSQNGLRPVLEQGGVFCLCSSDEPWGTVAQEFAAAGFPLLLSHQCGSSGHFLQGNGLLCDGSDTESIKAALLSFIALPSEELQRMGKRSHELGMRSGSDTWASVLCSTL